MLGLLFPFSESAKLKELLRLENPNLEDILDQDCILNELKNSNRRLVNYLCRPHVFDALITYITQFPKKLTHEPTESVIDFKPNKFPFVACDLLSQQNETISQHFLGLAGDPNIEKENRLQPSFWRQIHMGIFGSPNKQAQESKDIEMEIEQTPEAKTKPVAPITKFLEFLDQPPPLNPTQAGYFAKVLRNFIYYKPERTCKLLFGQYYRYLEKLNQHIYSDSLQELLSIIIKLEAPFFVSNPKEYYIIQRRELVSHVMLNLFEKSDDQQDVHDIKSSMLTNSSNLLAGLLSNCRTFTNGELIVTPLLHESFIKKCMKALTNVNLTNVMSPIIKQLCEYYMTKHATSKEPVILTFPFGQDSFPESKVPDSEALIPDVVKSIQAIMDVIKIENKDLSPHKTEFQYRKTQHSFGPYRIKLIELIYSFLKLQNDSVYNEIKRTGLLNTLLPLFTKNPWNNILHMALLRIFTFIVAKGSESLKMALFAQTGVLEFFGQAADDSSFEMNSKSKSKVQKGYMAYLNILANKIKDSEDTLIQSYCRKSAAWKKFSDTILFESNKKNSVILMEPSQRNSLTASPIPNSSSFNGRNSFHDFVEDKITETINIPSTKVHGDRRTGLGLFKSKENLSKFKEIGQADDIVSPTYNGDFIETDIKERKDCEIRYPQSVDVRFTGRFQNEIVLSATKSEILDMMESSIVRAVSPKMESMKVQAKNIDDEREEILYS